MKHYVEPFAECNGSAMRKKIRMKGVDETQNGEVRRIEEGNGRMRCLRGLTRVSKQININIRLKDLRVAVCPTGREIEGLPFAVLSKDSAVLRSENAGVSCRYTGRGLATWNRFNASFMEP